MWLMPLSDFLIPSVCLSNIKIQKAGAVDFARAKNFARF